MGTVKNGSEMLTSVTAVFVVVDQLPSRDDLDAMFATLANHFVDSDMVIVANGIDDELALKLKELIADTVDATCIFLGSRSDFDQARIVGIDHAIGDFVFLATPTESEIAALDDMIKATREGFDLVIAKSKGGNRGRAQGALPYRLFRRSFLKLLHLMTGVRVDPNPFSLRLMSRTAALHILGQRHAEILLKSLNIGSGFPAKVLEDAFDEPNPVQQRSLSSSLGKGLRAIVSSGTMPMRLASLTALVAGGLALIYSLYVLVTYFFTPDVAPGWTTVSLQVSGMMFLFSLIFVLLVEYTIQIYEGMPVSRRRFVIREIRSEHTRRSGRLNVVDGEGQFQLGAPHDLVADTKNDLQDTHSENS